MEVVFGPVPGEVLALRWANIQENMIHVIESLTYVKGQYIFSSPKTQNSTRRVAITEDLIDVLALHKKQQEAEKQKALGLWVEHDLVFATEVGTPLHPSNLTRLHTRLIKEARVPHIRFHNLRHLHASLAIKDGVDPKVLADRLGHSRASFTLDSYTHLFEEQRVSSAVSLLSFIGKPKSQAVN